MFIVQTIFRPTYQGGASDDELDLTTAKSKATYEEIKDYVLEYSGLKVSSLYIAQIKEKCGIIERVNYNLPKSENSRQPKCTPEKEASIRKALDAKRGGELYIVLPEGVFISFGKSVSKTTILGVRKKDRSRQEKNKPHKVFLATAKEVGYEVGKKDYRPHNKSDLKIFLEKLRMYLDGIYQTENGGECGWVEQDKISFHRIDANFLLNIQDRSVISEKFNMVVPLNEVCEVKNVSKNPLLSEMYYLEIPDISPNIGAISNIRYVKGININSSMHIFYGGDVIFSRINLRKNRVMVIPQEIKDGLVSNEDVDLLPSNMELSGLEVRLINAISCESMLKTCINEVKKNYDVVLVDCMPSLGMLTINALAAVDSVVIPTQPIIFL